MFSSTPRDGELADLCPALRSLLLRDGAKGQRAASAGIRKMRPAQSRSRPSGGLTGGFARTISEGPGLRPWAKARAEVRTLSPASSDNEHRPSLLRVRFAPKVFALNFSRVGFAGGKSTFAFCCTKFCFFPSNFPFPPFSQSCRGDLYGRAGLEIPFFFLPLLQGQSEVAERGEGRGGGLAGRQRADILNCAKSTRNGALGSCRRSSQSGGHATLPQGGGGAQRTRARSTQCDQLPQVPPFIFRTRKRVWSGPLGKGVQWSCGF